MKQCGRIAGVLSCGAGVVERFWSDRSVESNLSYYRQRRIVPARSKHPQRGAEIKGTTRAPGASKDPFNTWPGTRLQVSSASLVKRFNDTLDAYQNPGQRRRRFWDGNN
jgi:hypothetical protein